jgi:flagellar biosynthesis activator protein FlaF
MQQPSADTFFAPLNRAAAAYKAIIRRTVGPRDIEHRVFAQITAALQEAASPDAHFTKRIQAAHRNRELWQTLACDLAGDDNALPDDLRAKLISLAIWVTGETSRVIRDGASLQPLIDVNSSIMQGLQSAAKKVA